eukprot:CAMPEP_0201977570 /NCGR_PEP_ID=MMETSP0904-20121228/61112_1 /ASSEMBLY_ACC=CAM_ASM_000553 /TAXON_ID=420261 /ORGANISM="Thalassiosira antarctica, Strain CCMP982" /LENGTH=107 /DNA_ID=CAMNT_0048528995 /DNA_START=67 /DNA_END=390 /DNA_ORIENTATION=-
MEEYDDLATGPTKDGSINLSHNTWKTLPPELSNFSTTLLHLEMSNNQLTSIPESIGALILLQTLDVSLNQIETIDGAIGKASDCVGSIWQRIALKPYPRKLATAFCW